MLTCCQIYFSSHVICRDEEEFLLSQPVVFRGGQVWWTGHCSAVGDALPPQVCDSTFSTPKRIAWGKVRRKRRGGVVFVWVTRKWGIHVYTYVVFFVTTQQWFGKLQKNVIEPLNMIVHVFKPSCSETSFQHLLRYLAKLSLYFINVFMESFWTSKLTGLGILSSRFLDSELFNNMMGFMLQPQNQE